MDVATTRRGSWNPRMVRHDPDRVINFRGKPVWRATCRRCGFGAAFYVNPADRTRDEVEEAEDCSGLLFRCPNSASEGDSDLFMPHDWWPSSEHDKIPIEVDSIEEQAAQLSPTAGCIEMPLSHTCVHELPELSNNPAPSAEKTHKKKRQKMTATPPLARSRCSTRSKTAAENALRAPVAKRTRSTRPIDG